MQYAQLDNAGLSQANLENTNLDNASLVGADLSFASLQGASLAGATLGVAPGSGSAASLRGAFMINVDLTDADMRSVDFTDAHLYGASSDALFVRTKLDSANFTNAILAGAVFTNATLTDTVFNGAQLANASFEGADSHQRQVRRRLSAGSRLLDGRLRDRNVAVERRGLDQPHVDDVHPDSTGHLDLHGPERHPVHLPVRRNQAADRRHGRLSGQRARSVLHRRLAVPDHVGTVSPDPPLHPGRTVLLRELRDAALLPGRTRSRPPGSVRSYRTAVEDRTPCRRT